MLLSIGGESKRKVSQSSDEHTRALLLCAYGLDEVILLLIGFLLRVGELDTRFLDGFLKIIRPFSWCTWMSETRERGTNECTWTIILYFLKRFAGLLEMRFFDFFVLYFPFASDS
jgi:hypothetical protein